MAEQKSRELGAKEGKVGFGHNRWLKSRKVCGSRGGQAPSYLRRPQLVFECPRQGVDIPVGKGPSAGTDGLGKTPANRSNRDAPAGYSFQGDHAKRFVVARWNDDDLMLA
jgi:hypothetical protein